MEWGAEDEGKRRDGGGGKVGWFWYAYASAYFKLGSIEHIYILIHRESVRPVLITLFQLKGILIGFIQRLLWASFGITWEILLWKVM